MNKQEFEELPIGTVLEFSEDGKNLTGYDMKIDPYTIVTVGDINSCNIGLTASTSPNVFNIITDWTIQRYTVAPKSIQQLYN